MGSSCRWRLGPNPRLPSRTTRIIGVKSSWGVTSQKCGQCSRCCRKDFLFAAFLTMKLVSYRRRQLQSDMDFKNLLDSIGLSLELKHLRACFKNIFGLPRRCPTPRAKTAGCKLKKEYIQLI